MKHPNQIPDRFLETSLWTLHKKGDRREASNYRPISIPHPIYRLITKIKKDELLYKLDHMIGHYQHGFRPGRTCGTGIFQVRRFRSKYKNPISLMLDVKKAFDSVSHTHLLKVLADLVDEDTYQLIKRLYINGTTGHILGTNRWYNQKCGVRQGYPLSPILFDIYLDSALKKVKVENNELMISFADDISLHGANMGAIKKLLKKVTTELEKIGLTIDPLKSEAVGKTENNQTHIKVGDKEVKLKNSGRLLGQYIGVTKQHCTKTPLEDLKEQIDILNQLPLTFLERVRVCNMVLIPKIVYRLETIEPNDTIIKQVDMMMKKFVKGVKGLMVGQADKTLYSKRGGLGLELMSVRWKSAYLLVCEKSIKLYPQQYDDSFLKGYKAIAKSVGVEVYNNQI